jgi:hypothetical protein
MKSVDQKPDQPQSPIDAFVSAVHRGEVCLSLEYDSVTGEIADENAWKEILEAAGAHPRLVEGIELTDDKSETARLRRLELEK